MLRLTTLQREILQRAAKGRPLQAAALADEVAGGTTWGTASRNKVEAEIERLTQMGYLYDFCEGDLATSEKGLARLDPSSPRNTAIRILGWLATSATGGAIAAIASGWISAG
ncbi:MAG: hypothetical protein OXI73_03360 [Rhodospirillales bacterium]|nr:hypothetical protein [Rhodospirillales bacterium]